MSPMSPKCVALVAVSALLLAAAAVCMAGAGPKQAAEALKQAAEPGRRSVSPVKPADVSAAARASFKLPRMFDFNAYKRKFNKHYESHEVELARRKLFLARAFRVYIAAVNYKRGLRNSYLALNEFSDMTLAEIRHNAGSRFRFKPKADGEASKPAGDEAASEAAGNTASMPDKLDLEAVAKELEELRREHGSDQQFGKVLAQLDNLDGSADPAAIETGMNKPTSNAPNPSPKLPKNPRQPKPKLKVSRKSNNPHYLPVELESQGADEAAEGRRPGADSSQMPQEDDESTTNHGLESQLSAVNYLRELVRAEDEEAEPEAAPKASKLPDEVFVDHRQSECFNPVREQGHCGSCYIFSTMSLYEYGHCLQTGELLQFSEQYVLDCGQRSHNNGCDGGYEDNVANFVATYGLELRHRYPYKEVARTCPYEKRVSARQMGYLRALEPRLVSVKKADYAKFLQKTPVLVRVSLVPSFYEYGGGVHWCLDSESKGAHAMLMVGHGRQDGLEYWLIRNSHGARWGEKGYYRLDKRSDCLYEGTGFVLRALLEERPLLEPELNSLYDKELTKSKWKRKT